MSQRIQYKTLLITLVVVSIFPVFGNLGEIPIRLWDESRLAINAIEMSRNQQWLVPYYDGLPDMWNTKPPLLIWLQTFMIKLIGVHPLAIRLPVAFAVMGTFLYLYFFLGRTVKNYLFGFITVLILMTSGSYLTEHVSRTGDYDGLLILFTTLFSFTYYQYLETLEKKHLYLFFLFLWLAVLTKSIAGLMFLPGLLLFTLWQRKFIEVVKSKHFYIGLLIFIVLTASYYLGREYYNPGYLEAVYNNELSGRFLETLEENELPLSYYLTFDKYTYWRLLTGAGVLLFILLRHLKGPRKVVGFSILMAASFLSIITYSQTKLEWYDASAYPFLAVVTAYPIFLAIQFVTNILKQKAYQKIVTVTLIIALFSYPYFQILDEVVYNPQEESWEQPWYKVSWYMKDLIKNDNPYNINSVIINDYSPQVSFYVGMANDRGIKLNQKTNSNIIRNETVLVESEETVNELNNLFFLERKLTADNGISILRIKERKRTYNGYPFSTNTIKQLILTNDTQNTSRLAIVIPCFNEQEVLFTSAQELLSLLKSMIDAHLIADDSFLLFVDDGSIDMTWVKIKELSENHRACHGLRLSRNFGHQNALLAGLHQVNGVDMVVSIDADLQDDIGAIKEMVKKYHAGADIVYGVRNNRKVDSSFKRNTALLFYKLMSLMGVETVYNHADFRLMSKRAIDVLKDFKETNLYLRGLIPQIGFRTDVVYYERKERLQGESKYNLKKMIALAWNGVSSMSIKPLRFVTACGFIIFFITMLFSAYALYSYLFRDTVVGWASIVLPMYFLGGIQLLCIGLIGEYIANIYKEIKNRPRYIIDEYIGS